MTLKISDDEDGHPRIEADGIAASLKSCGEEGHWCYRKEGAKCCVCSKVAKRHRCNACRFKRDAKGSS